MTVRRFRPAVAVIAVALLAQVPVLAAAGSSPAHPGPEAARVAARAAEPSYQSSASGFRSVLAYGEGQTTSATDLAAYEATGQAPASFTNQADLYNAVVAGQPRGDADLSRYYKSSDFAVPTGSDVGSTETVDGATVIRDARYAVPHIYASTRSSGMYAAGYVTAQDRLFLMDVLRRTAEGRLAGLLGASAAQGDSAQLGQFDLSPAELTAEVKAVAHQEGAEGRQAVADIEQYVAGINGFIAATRTNPDLLPAEYPALGATPAAWTLADTAAEAYLLIAQFTVAGDGEQFQSDLLDRLRQRLGVRRGQAVFDDLRQRAVPDAFATTTAAYPSDRVGAPSRAAEVHLTPGTLVPRDAVASSGGSSSSAGAEPAWATRLAHGGLRLPGEASNALLVEGRHTKSGHPVAAMGPQVSYYSPEIFDEYELHAPGIQVSGVVFPGASPYPLIGHAKNFAWTGTTALGDNADTFAEVLCNPDGSRATYASTHYVYRGKCRAFTSRTVTEQTPVAPTSPAPPQTITLHTLRSVHGPVTDFARVGGRPVALTRATAVYHHGIRSVVAFELLAENKVHGPRQFVAAMRHFTGNENWFYVSRSHIAWYASGWYQRHAPHTDLELPTWGTGRDDWAGFRPATYDYRRQPASFNAVSIDPARGFLASWNNKGSAAMASSPGTWTWGRVQRVDLLADPTERAIRRHHKLSLADVVGISGNASTQDLRAVEVLPTMLRMLGGVRDPRSRKIVADLRGWLRSGAHRRATGGRSYDDHSAAVLAFDAWWVAAVHRIYDPLIGRGLVDRISTEEGLVLADGATGQRPVTTGFFGGWQSQLLGTLDQALAGRRGAHAPSAPQAGPCGHTPTRCRRLLRGALHAAIASVAKAQGSADPTTWRKPVLCATDAATPTCDQNQPLTAGAVATPPQPFENRGTFHQAVEIR